jgi:hypothetical protein
MDYSTLSKVYKALGPETWKAINLRLGQYALAEEYIEGSRLRVDTTAYETNIRYPADSRLLWDGYRVLARWLEGVREYDPEAVGNGRLQRRRRIAHRAHRKIEAVFGRRPRVPFSYAGRIEILFGIMRVARAPGTELALPLDIRSE